MIAAAMIAFGAGAQTLRKVFDPTSVHGQQSRELALPAVKPDEKALPNQTLVRTQSSPFASATGSVVTPLVKPEMQLNLGRFAAGDVELWGNLVYTKGQTPVGMVKVPLNTVPATLDSKAPACSYAAFQIGEKYYCYYYYNLMGLVVYYRVYVVNIADNCEVEGFYNVSRVDNLATVAAVNPKDNEVYGVFFNSDGSTFNFSRLNMSMMTPTKIADIPGNWNAFSFDSNGQAYAVDYSGNLLKVNITDGTTTVVGNTGVVPKYLTGGTIDQATNTFYWAVNNEELAGLYSVNLVTGAATNLVQYADDDEIAGLFVPYIAASGAPAAPINLTTTYSQGSLSGKVGFDVPSTTYGGATSTGALTYYVYANGEQVATGTTSYGAHVDVDMAVSASGTYIYKVRLGNAIGMGPMSLPATVYVGKDAPSTPVVTASYDKTAAQFNIKWNTSIPVHDGYMDSSKLTYTVTRYPGGVAVAANIKDTVATDNVAYPESLVSYYYTVQAICDGVASEAGASNTTVLGEIRPPYFNSISTQEDFDVFTSIDANDDGKKWAYYYNSTSKVGLARIQYNTAAEMDDWLISPAIALEAGKAYYVSVDMKGHSTSYAEKFEIKYGSAPTAEAMTKELVPATEIKIKEFENFGDYIIPTVSGNYYVGIHGISAKNQYYLYAANFKVSGGISGTAPNACTDIKVENIYGGSPKAQISFKTPVTTFAGEDMSLLNDVKVYRDNMLVQTFISPAVGSQLSFTDSPARAGEYTYTFVASNADGAGRESIVNTFVGVDYPFAVTAASIVENGIGNVKLKWSAVTTDQNGNLLPPGEITYVIKNTDGDIVVDNLPQSQTSFEINNIVAAGSQTFAQYNVFAQTSRGLGTGMNTGMIAVGTPYSLPYEESFSEGSVSHIIGTQSNVSGTCTWSIAKDATFSDLNACDGDNGFIYCTSSNTGGKASIFTGKISFEDAANPELTFATYNIVGEKADKNTIEVLVSEDGVNYTSVFSKSVVDICGDAEGWNKARVSLSAYAGKTVYVKWVGGIETYKYLMLDAIRISEAFEYDLTARSITAPAAVVAGEEFSVQVVVENSGIKAAESYIVNVYRNDELVKALQGPELAVSASATLMIPQTLNVMNDVTSVYYAKIDWSKDQNVDDNTTDSITVNLNASNLPTPSNVSAIDGGIGVNVKWTAAEPVVAEQTLTEGFESAEAGNNIGVNGWIFYDEDGGGAGGVENIPLPGINSEQPVAYAVQSVSSINNATFTAHSGDKFITTMYNSIGSTKQADWLISPLLSGKAQTIKFYARSYSDQYGLEQIECYYSTTDNKYTSFTNKCMDKTGVPVGGDNRDYTLYEVAIPAGARYFAIKCVSNDNFMLFIDDITYQIGGGSTAYNLKGYNIYRDGEKINDAPVTETRYLDGGAMEGEHTYFVSAVYTEGESAAAGPAIVTCAVVSSISDAVRAFGGVGKVVVLNAAGMHVTVTDASGITIYAGVGCGRLELPASAGMYVVKTDGYLRKVVVK